MRRRKIKVTTLNETQKQAVFSPLEPTLVVAGAGTGKTTVIIRRYEYLIRECNIDPASILIVTFTQKAIREIKIRVQKLFEDEPIKDFCISTFHKFCMNLITEETGPFSVCHVKKGIGYTREAIERVGSSLRAYTTISGIILKLRWIEHVENRPFNEKDLIKSAKRIDPRISEEKIKEKYKINEIREIYKEYLKILKENQSLFFDDILFKAEKLLDDEDIRSKWDSKIKAILFDEFQDVDPIQFRIITKLSQDNKNIFCVGDPDQSIYGFRNALPKSFEEFKKKFPSTAIFKLERNYRSTPEILAVANQLINVESNSFSKNLTTNNPSGDKVRYFLTDNTGIEAEEVLRIIQNLNENFGVPYKNFAILFRNWSYSKKINNVFLAKNIPFLSKDLTKLLERTEIKDLFACLTIAFERKNVKKMNEALLRVINKPPRGFGKRRREELERLSKEKKLLLIEYVVSKSHYDSNCRALAAIIKIIKDIAFNEQMSIKDRVTEILKEFGLWQRWKDKPERFETVKSLLKAVFDNSVSDYKSALRRVKSITRFAVEKDKIFLTTIHGSKGLEFDYVFVISLNENFLPSKYSIREIENDPTSEIIAEERRLLYVALTRARKALYLVSSTGEAGVSRFVKEIEDKLEKSANLVGEISDTWDDFERDSGEEWHDEEEDFQKDALTDVEEEEDDESDEDW